MLDSGGLSRGSGVDSNSKNGYRLIGYKLSFKVISEEVGEVSGKCDRIGVGRWGVGVGCAGCVVR